MSNEVKLSTVLIADDGPENLDIIKAILLPFYAVKVVKSGELALKVAQEQNIDLILLDILMPDMDGFEVCRRLKDASLTQHIPVIFLTAKNSSQDELLGFKLGAVDYIAKPFIPAVVLARVRTQLLLKSKMDLLETLVALDGLTEISNRRAFDEYYERQWNQAVRLKTPLSLAMIDIDMFKSYNDYYGHYMGDDCLKRVAKALLNAVNRPEDLVARFGGEEFVCVLPGSNYEGAGIIAERLLQSVKQLQIDHEKSTVDRHLSVSVGVATLSPKPYDNTAYLIEAADKMLYEAKNNGRNRVCVDFCERSEVLDKIKQSQNLNLAK